MLGLTESAIAHDPEKIEGIASTWREKQFNASYVLTQKPEVILFSTELKPSSPAERALFLYSEFRRSYRLEFLFGSGRPFHFYRRFRDYERVLGPDQPPQFVNLLHDGLTLTKTDRLRAIYLLQQALSIGVEDCSALYLVLGDLYALAGISDSADTYFQKGMSLDGGGSYGLWFYSIFLYNQKHYEEARQRFSTMIRTIPTAGAFLEAHRVYRSKQKGFPSPPKEITP